jgi:hypothetical protein
MHLKGFKLCMTITSAPPQAPLYERMRFAGAHHTEVAMRLSAMWVVVSLATQSILGCLPIDVSQSDVMGGMVTRFQE